MVQVVVVRVSMKQKEPTGKADLDKVLIEALVVEDLVELHWLKAQQAQMAKVAVEAVATMIHQHAAELAQYN
jgi:hypothetical protein